MCVAVVLGEGSELTPEEIYKMGNANGDGFGIAWVEDGLVNWWKTLNYNVEYLTHVVNTLKDSPRFVHFRLSTVGGVNVSLCHPFEVGPRAAYAERGRANKVMMHNGHWFRAGEMYDILKKENALPDDGPWSDTRLAAMLASWDEDWLSTVTGKVATLDSDGNIKLFGDWTDLRAGIKVSNKSWDHNFDYRRTGSGRRWEGWGWSDKHWINKEEHEKAKKEAKEKEEKEKEEKARAKEQSKEKGDKGTTGKNTKQEGKEETNEEGKKGESNSGQVRRHMGVGREERHLLPSGTGEPVADQEGGEEDPRYKIVGGYRYDLYPWQQPTTKQWYQVDPTSLKGTTYRVRSLTEAQAREIVEQITAARSKIVRSET